MGAYRSAAPGVIKLNSTASLTWKTCTWKSGDGRGGWKKLVLIFINYTSDSGQTNIVNNSSLSVPGTAITSSRRFSITTQELCRLFKVVHRGGNKDTGKKEVLL